MRKLAREHDPALKLLYDILRAIGKLTIQLISSMVVVEAGVPLHVHFFPLAVICRVGISTDGSKDIPHALNN